VFAASLSAKSPRGHTAARPASAMREVEQADGRMRHCIRRQMREAGLCGTAVIAAAVRIDSSRAADTAGTAEPIETIRI
jgi:hypothetical protein